MLVKKQGHKEFQWLTNLGCLDTPLGMVVAFFQSSLAVQSHPFVDL